VGLKSYLSAGINSAAPTMFFENRATSVRSVSLTGFGDGETVTLVAGAGVPPCANAEGANPASEIAAKVNASPEMRFIFSPPKINSDLRVKEIFFDSILKIWCGRRDSNPYGR
jgi:hypothetical protein